MFVCAYAIVYGMHVACVCLCMCSHLCTQA